MMRKIFLMMLIILPLALFAELEDPPADQASADSLLIAREQEIQTEYGFRDSNTLRDVAQKLQIGDIMKWKAALGLEPGNQVLDNMSLRKLGITPYRALLAQQTADFSFNEMSNLTEISAVLNIPLKKLKSMLGNSDPLDKSWDNTSLQALEISLEQVKEVEAEFNEDLISYAASVLMVGMLVVFSALILTSLIISQLVHLNRDKKQAPSIKVSSSGQLKSASPSLSGNVIVAAITALHMHKMDLEERRRMVLTFRRTPTNQWRASAVLSMPNREMNSVRRPK